MEFLLTRDEILADATSYRMAVEAYASKQMTEEEFKGVRGLHGLHRQKGGEAWMARIKAPGGRLDRSQVEALADISGSWSGRERVHLTTRQDLQFYGLALEESGDMMEALASAGLACVESGGPAVRNITCPAESGLLEGESFDPFPWALSLAQALAGRLEFRSLPRKFKIAFASEAGNIAAAMACDLGFVARQRKGPDGEAQFGFEVYAGGGLGAAPRKGCMLASFLPAPEVLDVAEAVLRHFNTDGKRDSHARARLKYLVMDEGDARFSASVWDLRRGVKLEPARSWQPMPPKREQALGGRAPQRWLEQNTFPQKQEGFSAVRVRLPLGDLSPLAFQGLAKMMRQFELPELRLGLDQGLLLPWVPTSRLALMHTELAELGLGLEGAGATIDVVCCAGPETCNRGLVNSRALAREIESTLAGHPLAGSHGARIHVSGCSNGCGHHLLAAFGLQGQVRRHGKSLAPHYRLSLAGGAKSMGRVVAELPARSVASALSALLDAYAGQRKQGYDGTLRQWAEALNENSVGALLSGLPPVSDDEMARDIGSDAAYRAQGLGASEC